MFSAKFILTNICGHFECFFGKNYLYCALLGTSLTLFKFVSPNTGDEEFAKGLRKNVRIIKKEE